MSVTLEALLKAHPAPWKTGLVKLEASSQCLAIYDAENRVIDCPEVTFASDLISLLVEAVNAAGPRPGLAMHAVAAQIASYRHFVPDPIPSLREPADTLLVNGKALHRLTQGSAQGTWLEARNYLVGAAVVAVRTMQDLQIETASNAAAKDIPF